MITTREARDLGPDATDNQKNAIRNMANDRAWMGKLTDAGGYTLEAALRGSRISKIEARFLISELSGCRMKPKNVHPTVSANDEFRQLQITLKDVPNSRYAMVKHGDDTVYFFQVCTSRGPSKVKYLVRLIGAPGDYRRIRVTDAEQTQIGRRIGTNPAEFAKAYAAVAEHCARCFSPLTNPISLARGLGPDCAKKF